ncbi:MAG TPA: Obg family GTPase CgtA [Verrucomicrobiae bacterium]|nr:Obg family GTPase CgtA [Verrucomicrobiae bacterium]
MFVDEVKIFACAGHGGKGCIAFLRETSRPKGGPAGGNGGHGGNVILQADHDLNNLVAQYYQPRLVAQKGEKGMGKGMDGHAGKDLLVKVPCGTLIWRLASSKSAEVSDAERDEQSTSLKLSTCKRSILRYAGSERAMEINLKAEAAEPTEVHSHQKGELIADLTEHGQQFVLCKGGRGGLGNRNFATAARQAPRFAQPGEPGGEGEFLLELRIIADVGLVGYPNAGKSTLLTAISKARPKIAAYPFTTLTPQIGIVEYPDWHRLTVCDVPGLIEGAHKNVGLGHSFLRHIERCKMLVLLLDMAATDGRQPWDDYQNLLDELGLYDPTLLEKPRLVVANKMDEPVAEENLKKFKRKIRKTPVLPIAAAFDEGVEKFRKLIREAVAEAVDVGLAAKEHKERKR